MALDEEKGWRFMTSIKKLVQNIVYRLNAKQLTYNDDSSEETE